VPAKWDEDTSVIAAAVGCVEAAGASVVGTVIQRRGVSRSPRPGGAQKLRVAISAATYMGSGKVKELAELVRKVEAAAVVFCNRLSPAQLRRVGKIVDVPVILFTRLI